MNRQIIIVDDDQQIRTLLKTYLEKNHYDVVGCADGAEFEQAFKQNKANISLVILDIMLPDTDGFNICQNIRKTSEVPVIMLTANSDDTDRILGLELGADDYLAKPFNPRELLARIKAIHRRYHAEEPAKDLPRYFCFNNYVLDSLTRSVADQAGNPIKLSGTDFQLLFCFVQNAGQLLSRNALSDFTRGREIGPFDRYLDVQISRLRGKLKSKDELFKTVRGAGYIFSAQVTARDALV